MEEQVKQIMADILGISPEAIDESTSMDKVSSWDSFNHLNLCLALEEFFGITLEIHEMESILSYFDIIQILNDKM